MQQEEITVRVVLKRGEVMEDILTCDFSYDYVRINAEYRT
jgi:glutamate N-acetyltransferase/amino-acid N-acetyltransferase